VPFPFVEAPRLRERPAVVVRSMQPHDGIDLLWVLMITSAANKGWRGDVSLEDNFLDCGLQVPCIVRTVKIATVEAGRSRKSGRLPKETRDAVREKIALASAA
jgi:mRNA interferase MazF